jgi:hypothetical protein
MRCGIPPTQSNVLVEGDLCQSCDGASALSERTSSDQGRGSGERRAGVVMRAWAESVDASVSAIARHFGPVRGATPAEIRGIEREAGGALPAAYVAFLREVGGDPGDFMRGSDFDVRYLRGPVAENCAEVLAEDGAEPLPPRAFVFFGHQGYQYYWFVSSAEPDPPVFYYSTSTRLHTKLAESFSEWLEMFVESEMRVRSQLSR